MAGCALTAAVVATGSVGAIVAAEAAAAAAAAAAVAVTGSADAAALVIGSITATVGAAVDGTDDAAIVAGIAGSVVDAAVEAGSTEAASVCAGRRARVGTRNLSIARCGESTGPSADSAGASADMTMDDESCDWSLLTAGSLTVASGLRGRE